MKKILSVLFIVLATNASAQTKDERELLMLHAKKFNWLIDKNYDSLNWLLDDQVLYIHSSGMTESKKDVTDNLKSGKLSYTMANVKESRARIFGNTGVVTGKGTFTGAGDGKPFEVQIYYTEVYTKAKKQWKLVSRHASRLTP